MSLKIINNGFEDVSKPVCNNQTMTLREVEGVLAESYKRMESIRCEATSIQEQWNALKSDIDGIKFAKYLSENTLFEQFQKALNDLKLEYVDAKSTYTQYKQIHNKMLLESDSVDTSNVELDKSDIKYEIDPHKSIETNTEAVNEYEEFVSELQSLIDSGADAAELLDYMFDTLVPEEGISKTLAGELARSLMYILYVNKTQGSRFYVNEGLDCCGGSAQFLYDNGCSTNVTDCIGADDYEKAVFNIAYAIADMIISTPNFMSRMNNCNSREYVHTKISDLLPKHTCTISIPQDIQIHYGCCINIDEVCNYIKEKLTEKCAHNIKFNPETVYDYACELELIDLCDKCYDITCKVFEDPNVWADLRAKICSAQAENISTEEIDFSSDIFDTDLDSDYSDVTESFESSNTTLVENKEQDELTVTFLKYHNDVDNQRNKMSDFKRVWSILQEYGTVDKPVEDAFNRIPDTDLKQYIVDLITPDAE